MQLFSVYVGNARIQRAMLLFGPQGLAKGYLNTHMMLQPYVVVAKDGGPIWRDVVTASLTMRDFSDAFLEDYLATEGEHALGSVGCYRLEGPGSQLFSKIEGDYFAILGLPLMGLMDLLRRHGELKA